MEPAQPAGEPAQPAGEPAQPAGDPAPELPEIPPIPPITPMMVLSNHILDLTPSYRFVPEDHELVVDYLNAFIEAANDPRNFPNQLNQFNPAFAFSPMHLLLEEIEELPTEIINRLQLPEGFDVRIGSSFYIITNNLPELLSPAGWRWKAGRRRQIRRQNQLVGRRFDYYLLDVEGAPMGWSMYVYSNVNDNEPFILVRYLRRG